MEQFERFIRLVGLDNFNKIRNKKILVIGLGGVGGYATLSLIRSGINDITIVDYDVIDITNLNRQIITNIENVARKKTEVMKEEILKINPECVIKVIDKRIDEDNFEELFKDKVDYVIDACDTISVKMKIISYCTSHDIEFISCMGSGKKLNPSLFEITDIRKTSYDPIAKVIRKFVKDEGIRGKVPVVYSKEKPKDTGDNIGSFCAVVAVAGMLCSSYIINSIIDNNKEKNG